MRVPRIFTDQALSENTELVLDEAASHHCLKVLRMEEGRDLIVFNGKGGEYPAKITRKDKRSAFIETRGFCAENRESELHTHLAIAISRGERFDFVLQKATELGVTEISPLFTERTEVKLSGERLDKKVNSWKRIVTSACEQCGRNLLPTLNAPVHITDFLASELPTLRLVLHHRNTTSPSTIERPLSLALMIGPEGGLSDAEIAQAHEAGFKSLALGPRVLRTETAPIAALAIMQQLWGDI